MDDTVDSHPAAIITGSPVARWKCSYQGSFFDGRGLALDKSYACCTISRQRGCSRCRYGKSFGNNTPCRTIMALLKLQRRPIGRARDYSSLNLLYSGWVHHTVPAAWNV